MKTKLVNHIAGNAMHELQSARGEAQNMRDKYRDLLGETSSGMGLDFAVLREKLDAAVKLLELLT